MRRIDRPVQKRRSSASPGRAGGVRYVGRSKRLEGWAAHERHASHL